ncbi:MAG: hypothetical protein K5685_05400 [Bacteroidales bacterium]|nr:hypothetical protein [Bacteroidales bacterium]
MKRRFLRILPLAVAVLLATSCNKDENNDQEIVNNGTEVVTPENTVKTVPFTLKVKNGKGISKVSYADNGSEVQPSFEVGDKVVISGIGISDTELTCAEVENGVAVFTGDIASGIADGTTLTATVKVNESSDIVSSTTSMVDLIENCAHNYEGTFEYTSGNDAECTLKDDKSYLEFTLAEGQKKVSVNGTWYDVNQTSHQAWVAVNGGTNVTTRIKGSKEVTAGVIYTIECTDVVDLGLSVLWCTSNATSSETDQKNWEDAKTLANSVIGYDLPSASNFKELTGEETVEGVPVTQSGKWDGSGVENGYTFSTDYGSVFFPAAGYDGVYEVGYEGDYWSSSHAGGDSAWLLSFSEYEDAAGVCPGSVYSKYSVRLVRGL